MLCGGTIDPLRASLTPLISDLPWATYATLKFPIWLETCHCFSQHGCVQPEIHKPQVDHRLLQIRLSISVSSCNGLPGAVCSASRCSLLTTASGAPFPAWPTSNAMPLNEITPQAHSSVLTNNAMPVTRSRSSPGLVTKPQEPWRRGGRLAACRFWEISEGIINR